MSAAKTPVLIDRLILAEQLRIGGSTMLEPQDLPGRYGRVIGSIDRVLAAIDCQSVVVGGWAVWRHGYIGRVTQDVDIVLPQASIEEFLNVAAVSGFQVLKQVDGRWPKLMQKETDVQVDILPEGERPGRPPRFAPTTISSPSLLGADGSGLRYVTLNGLVELKLAAGRIKDQADVVELIRGNTGSIELLRAHLLRVHESYAKQFDHLVIEARTMGDD